MLHLALIPAIDILMKGNTISCHSRSQMMLLPSHKGKHIVNCPEVVFFTSLVSEEIQKIILAEHHID